MREPQPSSLSFCDLHVKAGLGLGAPGKGMNSFQADNLENLMSLMENTQACFFLDHALHTGALTQKSFMDM